MALSKLLGLCRTWSSTLLQSKVISESSNMKLSAASSSCVEHDCLSIEAVLRPGSCVGANQAYVYGVSGPYWYAGAAVVRSCSALATSLLAEWTVPKSDAFEFGLLLLPSLPCAQQKHNRTCFASVGADSVLWHSRCLHQGKGRCCRAA